jgi:hypothetical protein
MRQHRDNTNKQLFYFRPLPFWTLSPARPPARPPPGEDLKDREGGLLELRSIHSQLIIFFTAQ